MLSDLIDVAPDAVVSTILTGPWRGTFEGQDAKDIVDSMNKAKDLKVRIVSTSIGVWYNKDQGIRAAIRSLSDSGTFLSWFWSKDTLDNVFRSRSNAARSEDVQGLGPDGVLIYDCFDSEYYHQLLTLGSVSGTAPRMAGILAQILQADPNLKGAEIKKLLDMTGVKVSEKYITSDYKKIPNVERLVRIAENHLSAISELNEFTPVRLTFSEKNDVILDGVVHEGTTEMTMPGTDHFTMMWKNGDRITLQPCTQIVSVLLLKDGAGRSYIDATFKGSIQTDAGKIDLIPGINPVGKPIEKIMGITIQY